MIESFDYFFLNIMHVLECSFLTVLNTVISFVGEKGIVFLLLAVICMLFPRTRKFGVFLFGAVGCGALITNIILKDLIARERPYVWNQTYREWWLAVGSPMEDGYSFPSGHVTAAAAGCTAICLTHGKKWILPSAIWVFLTMCARTYLMVHHPTDVLAGLAVGVGSGFIAYYISEYLFKLLRQHREEKWAELCLDYSIPLVDDLADRAVVLFYEGKAYVLHALPDGFLKKLPVFSKPGTAGQKKSTEDAPAKTSVFSHSHSRPESLPEEGDSPRTAKASHARSGESSRPGNSAYKGKHERQ